VLTRDDVLWAACRALPEPQRTALVLRYYEQLEYAEIAELTGVREGSVRSRVSRGLAALRESMGESDE
jgi:RNA polymerase sigma factor (sigma-70 family)